MKAIIVLAVLLIVLSVVNAEIFCGPGTYVDADHCVPCALGSYAAAANQTECNLCPAGSGSNALRTACVLCAAGYSAAEDGDDCTICNIGTYATGTNNTECTACAVGKYAATRGASTCVNCLAGTIAAEEGSATCTPCGLANYASSAGSSSCAACATGTIAPATGMAACLTCPGDYTVAVNIDGHFVCYQDDHYLRDWEMGRGLMYLFIGVGSAMVAIPLYLWMRSMYMRYHGYEQKS
jgi:hypothetical protein